MGFTARGLLHHFGVAGSGFRPLSRILDCCLHGRRALVSVPAGRISPSTPLGVFSHRDLRPRLPRPDRPVPDRNAPGRAGGRVGMRMHPIHGTGFQVPLLGPVTWAVGIRSGARGGRRRTGSNTPDTCHPPQTLLGPINVWGSFRSLTPSYAMVSPDPDPVPGPRLAPHHSTRMSQTPLQRSFRATIKHTLSCSPPGPARRDEPGCSIHA